MTRVVLDSSALLALLFEEPGADAVASVLESASMSAANVAEVAAKYADRGLSTARLPRQLEALGAVIEPVTAQDADLQATVRRTDADAHGGRHVLSLGDRLCLALALRLGVPALTADRAWANLDLPIEVEQLR